MAKVYKGPYWNGKPEHDQNLFDMIVSKANKMWLSKPVFKNGIAMEDFQGEAFLLFESRKVHKSYDPSKGDFFRFFAVSLRNVMIDKLSTSYSHVKTTRARDHEEDSVRSEKMSGTEMAIQRIDDENLHERIFTDNNSPESIINLEEYEETVKGIAPTLYTVWFGSVSHPHDLKHPVLGHPLKSKYERMKIIEIEANAVLNEMGHQLFDHEISEETKNSLVNKIVDQFSRWRGERGEYKKSQKKPDPSYS